MDVWLFLLFLRNPLHKGQSITLFKKVLLGKGGIVVSLQTWKMRPQIPHWQALRYAVSPEWIQVWSVFVWKSWQTAQAPQGHWAPPSWECQFALVLTGSVEVAEWGSLLLCVLGLLAIKTESKEKMKIRLKRILSKILDLEKVHMVSMRKINEFGISSNLKVLPIYLHSSQVIIQKTVLVWQSFKCSVRTN